MRAVTSLDPQQDRLAIVLLRLGQRRGNVCGSAHRTAACLQDHVAYLHALLGGSAVRIDVRDNDPLVPRSLDARRRSKRETEALEDVIALGRAWPDMGFLLIRQRTELDRDGFLRSVVPIDQIRHFAGTK